MRRTISLSISTAKANAICWAIRGQPQLGLRRFISTTASMSSFFGPFGPGRRPRLGENNMRYFRLLSTLWRCSSVEGFRTTAERRTCRAHEKGAQSGDDTIRGAQIRRTLAAAIEDPQLMFDEHRLGNDGTEASWPC